MQMAVKNKKHKIVPNYYAQQIQNILKVRRTELLFVEFKALEGHIYWNQKLFQSKTS